MTYRIVNEEDDVLEETDDWSHALELLHAWFVITDEPTFVVNDDDDICAEEGPAGRTLY